MTERRTRVSITEEAIRKVGAKIHHKCPRCSQVEPKHWGADVAGIWISPFPVEKSAMPPAMVPTLMLTCSDCGYISIHNLKTLGVDTG